MRIALPLLLSLSAILVHAEAPRPLLLRRDVEVRKSADPERPPALTLKEGEKIWIGDEDGEFTLVRVRRANGWRQGFVFTEDLLIPATTRKPASEPVASRKIAVALQINASQMSQPGRQFTTTDMVHWTTSSYESHSVWPSLYVQFGRTNFWRVALGTRIVDFKGTAELDVGVNNSRSIEVKQTMYSGRVEKGFTIYGPTYLGVGVEVARGTSLTEYLDGVQVPTTDADLSVYAGGALGLGVELPFLEFFSATAEARFAYFPSVKPAAKTLDLSFGLAYWF